VTVRPFQDFVDQRCLHHTVLVQLADAAATS
jgi:hypothetical protein